MNDQNLGQAATNPQGSQPGSSTPVFGRTRYQDAAAPQVRANPYRQDVQPEFTEIDGHVPPQYQRQDQTVFQDESAAQYNQEMEQQPQMGDDGAEYDPASQDQYSLPDYLKPEMEEVVYQWNAFSRPYRKHNRRFFTTIVTIAALVTLIMFFSGQWQLAGVILAMGFLGYMMMVVPPHEIPYQITTFGLRVDSQLFYWEQITRFWFTTKYQTKILNIEITEFPFRIQMVVGGNATEEGLRHILSVVLIEQTPLPTTYDKVSKWWQDKIPLDFES